MRTPMGGFDSLVDRGPTMWLMGSGSAGALYEVGWPPKPRALPPTASVSCALLGSQLWHERRGSAGHDAEARANCAAITKTMLGRGMS